MKPVAILSLLLLAVVVAQQQEDASMPHFSFTINGQEQQPTDISALFDHIRSQIHSQLGSAINVPRPYVSYVQVDDMELEATTAVFSPSFTTIEGVVSVAGDLCTIDSSSNSDFEGKIAVATRGGCTFATKADNAMALNAIALIVVNNEGPAVLMGGSDSSVNIPVVMVGETDGPALADGSYVTVSSQADGDEDEEQSKDSFPVPADQNSEENEDDDDFDSFFNDVSNQFCHLAGWQIALIVGFSLIVLIILVSLIASCKRRSCHRRLTAHHELREVDSPSMATPAMVVHYYPSQ